MRLVVVIMVVWGCCSLRGLGQGEAWVGELRLELAWPEVAEELKREERFISSRFRPTVVMRRTADGSVRSRYLIVHDEGRGVEMEDKGASALADGLSGFLKTGKNQSPGEGIDIYSKSEDQVIVGCGNGVIRQMTKAQAEQLAAMLVRTRKRAKAFIGADIDLKRDAIRKLDGPVIEGWSITMKLGALDLPELGGRQWVWWQGWVSTKWSVPKFDLQLQPEAGAAPGPRSGRISSVFFEQLGRVPDSLARGKTVRWEGNGQLLRAFVENKAIFYRPDTGKAEDIRISLETAQEAWKMLEKRDRAAEWFAKEVEPGLEALLKKGDLIGE